MTKEQEAIENLTNLLNQRNEKQVQITTYDLFGNIETALNMLKEKDAEIEKYKRQAQVHLEASVIRTNKFNLERKKKDRQIDLMAEYIVSLDIEEDICVKTGRLNECDSIALGECENCIKQYFKELAERKSKE